MALHPTTKPKEPDGWESPRMQEVQALEKAGVIRSLGGDFRFHVLFAFFLFY